MEGIKNAMEGIRDAAEDPCTRGLIWATHKNCPRNDDEDIEESTERGDSKDNGCDSLADLPKVAREGTAEQ